MLVFFSVNVNSAGGVSCQCMFRSRSQIPCWAPVVSKSVSSERSENWSIHDNSHRPFSVANQELSSHEGKSQSYPSGLALNHYQERVLSTIDVDKTLIYVDHQHRSATNHLLVMETLYHHKLALLHLNYEVALQGFCLESLH